MSGSEDVHLVASPEESAAASPKSDEEDLEDVLASESELVDHDTKSLRFGKTLVTDAIPFPLFSCDSCCVHHDANSYTFSFISKISND